MSQSDPAETSDASTRLLGWLLGLALLYTLYFAKSLLLPVVVALLLALLLSPLVGVFKRFHVPRAVSAILLLLAIGGPLALLGVQLAEPAKKWIQLLPVLSESVSEQLDSFSQSLQPEAENVADQEAAAEEGSLWTDFLGFFGDDEEAEHADGAGQGRDSALSLRLMQSGLETAISMLAAAPGVVAQFVIGVILAIFLLVFGPNLYESVLQALPQARGQRRARLLVGKVQRELSRYILTVSAINTALGLATATALWLLEVDDALLWGALVGALNFAPYVGPLIAVCTLALVGIVQFGLELPALWPVLAYFVLNMLEAQLVTPTVLGHRMRLNPLIVMLWLILWGWLWGGGGVLLAVPLLVCLKLAAEQLEILQPWVGLIETRG